MTSFIYSIHSTLSPLIDRPCNPCGPVGPSEPFSPWKHRGGISMYYKNQNVKTVKAFKATKFTAHCKWVVLTDPKICNSKICILTLLNRKDSVQAEHICSITKVRIELYSQYNQKYLDMGDLINHIAQLTESVFHFFNIIVTGSITQWKFVSHISIQTNTY